jgi:hypothetical protein
MIQLLGASVCAGFDTKFERDWAGANRQCGISIASPKAKATVRDWFRARMYDLSV